MNQFTASPFLIMNMVPPVSLPGPGIKQIVCVLDLGRKMFASTSTSTHLKPSRLMLTEVDNLTEEEIYENWQLVDKADRSELEQFVTERIWKFKRVADAKNIIDAIWARKWKWYCPPNGTKERRVKSRLCARGFLDAQGKSLTTRAPTATRLSQRLLVSLSVIFGFSLHLKHGMLLGPSSRDLPSWKLKSIFARKGKLLHAGRSACGLLLMSGGT